MQTPLQCRLAWPTRELLWRIIPCSLLDVCHRTNPHAPEMPSGGDRPNRRTNSIHLGKNVTRRHFTWGRVIQRAIRSLQKSGRKVAQRRGQKILVASIEERLLLVRRSYCRKMTVKALRTCFFVDSTATSNHTPRWTVMPSVIQCAFP